MNNIGKTEGIIRACTGCQMCSAVCKFNAISIGLDREGFYKPVLNKKLCVNCGECVKSCYKYSHIRMSDNCLAVFASRSKETSVLNSTTSGGIAYLFSKYFILNSYKVCGVSYDYDKNIAVTEIASNFNEIEKFKGSKYIQAYSKNIFQKIINDKTDDRYAVFGLPCHIYALDEVLRKRKIRDRFVLIDLFCHGCPSMLVWKKTLGGILENQKEKKADYIEFRSKKHGWHEFSIYVKSGEKEYIGKNAMDAFYTLFFDNQILNRACYDCKLRSTLAYTDIRIGDFWGSQYDNDKVGTSSIVCVSEEGLRAYESLDKEFNVTVAEHSLEDVIKAQSYGKQYELNEKIRKETMNSLFSSKNIEEIKKEYIRSFSKLKKVKRCLKQIFQVFPQALRYKIKSIFHSM